MATEIVRLETPNALRAFIKGAGERLALISPSADAGYARRAGFDDVGVVIGFVSPVYAALHPVD